MEIKRKGMRLMLASLMLRLPEIEGRLSQITLDVFMNCYEWVPDSYFAAGYRQICSKIRHICCISINAMLLFSGLVLMTFWHVTKGAVGVRVGSFGVNSPQQHQRLQH